MTAAAVAPLAETGLPAADSFAEVHTPNMTTIEQVSEFLECDPKRMIKTIVFDAGRTPLVALVRGDHEVNEPKLARAAGVDGLVPAERDMIRRLTNAEVGFAGPVGLDARIICDQAVSVLHDGVTGANKTDHHLIHDGSCLQAGGCSIAAKGHRVEGKVLDHSLPIISLPRAGPGRTGRSSAGEPGSSPGLLRGQSIAGEGDNGFSRHHRRRCLGLSIDLVWGASRQPVGVPSRYVVLVEDR